MATTHALPQGALRSKFLVVGCGIVGLALNCFMAAANSSSWDVDFNQYYAAGKLVGSGHLYDWDAIRPLELERNAKAVPFGRIPSFAVAFKPLSLLPYPMARTLWFSIGLAALAGFVYLWPFSSRAWACVAICWSAPVAMCLLLGQDSILFLFFVALGIRLLRGGRDFWAGFAFSACIAKPHLALLLPIFLVARLKWKALSGGAVGATASLLVSFAAEGKSWPSRLLSLAATPDFDPAAGRMPNLRGLLSFFDSGSAAEVGLALVIVVAVWYLSRSQPLATAGAIVLASGLLLSHHAYFYDALLLIPALLLPFQRLYPVQRLYPEWMRAWAFFLFTPVPYLWLLTNAGILGQILITGYTLALITVTIRGNKLGSVTLMPGSAAPISPAN